MTNIRDYFKNLYFTTETEEQWNRVTEYENSVYEMTQSDDSKEFETWAREHEIDLNAIDENRDISIFTLWCWDLDEA